MTREEALPGISGVGVYAITGRYFELLRTERAVDVQIIGRGGVVLSYDKDMLAGIFHGPRPQHDPFEVIVITGTPLATVKFLVSDGFSGTRSAYVQQPHVGGIDTGGAIAVGAGAETLLIAEDGERSRVIFTADPANTDDIYIFGTGAVNAQAVIILGAGEMWIEDKIPGRAWYGRSGSGAQTLRWNGIYA